MNHEQIVAELVAKVTHRVDELELPYSIPIIEDVIEQLHDLLEQYYAERTRMEQREAESI